MVSLIVWKYRLTKQEKTVLTREHSRVTGDKKKSGLIRKYGLNMSRQAFREKAEAIGFKKVRFGRHGTCGCGVWC